MMSFFSLIFLIFFGVSSMNAQNVLQNGINGNSSPAGVQGNPGDAPSQSLDNGGASGSGEPRRPPPYFNGFYNSSHLRHLTDPPEKFDVFSAGFAPETGSDATFDSAKDLEEKAKGCQLACLDHGHCDADTHRCVCETFWMMNPFTKVRPHEYRPNCNWNIFVVIGTLIGIAGGLVLLAILLHYCCRRCCSKETPLKNRRYRLVSDDDMEGYGKRGAGMRIKRAPIMDSDEDEEEAVFEAKNPKFYGTQANTYKAGETSSFIKKPVNP